MLLFERDACRVWWGHRCLVMSPKTGHITPPFVYPQTSPFPHLIKVGLELIGFMSWIHIPTGMIKVWLGSCRRLFLLRVELLISQGSESHIWTFPQNGCFKLAIKVAFFTVVFYNAFKIMLFDLKKVQFTVMHCLLLIFWIHIFWFALLGSGAFQTEFSKVFTTDSDIKKNQTQTHLTADLGLFTFTAEVPWKLAFVGKLLRFLLYLTSFGQMLTVHSQWKAKTTSHGLMVFFLCMTKQSATNKTDLLNKNRWKRGEKVLSCRGRKDLSGWKIVHPVNPHQSGGWDATKCFKKSWSRLSAVCRQVHQPESLHELIDIDAPVLVEVDALGQVSYGLVGDVHLKMRAQEFPGPMELLKRDQT